MGRRGNRKGGGGRGGNRGGQRADYSAIDKHNEKYEGYYNGLNIVPEEEREELWTAMRRELPNSFRFTGSKGFVCASAQLARA
ncbi:hypothetical protein KEM55_005475 [Ascosphaera atra]|nr:hypothetical protein KEM55_005475 [Ascosphaera atra]